MERLKTLIKKIIGICCLAIFCIGILAMIFFIFDSTKNNMKTSDIIVTAILGFIIYGIFGLFAYRLLRNAKKDRKSVNSSASTVKQNNEKKNQIPAEESQADATERIINETSFDKAKSIDELNELSKLRSDRLFDERQSRIQKFNPYDVKISNNPINDLSYTEKNFLKQMDGQKVKYPCVYAYWTYEYSINFSEIMTKLISNEFLCIGDTTDKLKAFKVDELKRLLASLKLPVSGRKSELIKRIETNVDKETLRKILSNISSVYVLTPKGKNILNDLPKSATKNIDFEDACLNLISVGDVDGAYKLVCQNEINKIISRGLGISKEDWKQELNNGLSDYKIMKYSHFLESDISDIIPRNLIDFELQFKSCCILAIMLGMSADIIAKTFVRITGVTTNNHDIVSSLQKAIFNIMDEIQQNNFKELLEL